MNKKQYDSIMAQPDKNETDYQRASRQQDKYIQGLKKLSKSTPKGGWYKTKEEKGRTPKSKALREKK